MFVPLEIKNQKNSPFCLGCVISSIAEEYTGEICDEAYSYAMGKRFSGESINKWGIKPKDAIMGALRYGVLPKKHSPYSLSTHSWEFLSDWRNWEGLEHFTVKPFHSFKPIKNIEKALQKTSLLVGIYWQGEWDDDSHIPIKDDYHKLEPHEVRIIGVQDNYFVIQNSRGEDVGNNGLWYLPKEMTKTIHHIYQLSDRPWYNKLEELLIRYIL